MQSTRTPLPRACTGWASHLARAAGAILLFECVSGLAITFGSFRAAIEWGLLLHTVFGALTLLPLSWYFARHWQEQSAQAMSEVLLLGYVAVGALAICALTGVVLTVQGLAFSHTSPTLRYTHLVSTLVTMLTSIPHLILAWSRRRRTESGHGVAGWIGVATAATVTSMIVVVAVTAAYSGTKYLNRFPSDYSFPYGQQRPFAPSLARTSTNGAFDARSLSGSATCGSSGCHTQIYAEWQASAHRYAAMDPIFQGIQNVMAKQNGPESTRYCGGCHDPISLFSGTKNLFVANLTSLQGYQEGISCLACHSIQKTDIQGNANYTVIQPREYLWQWAPDHTLAALARNFLIRTWPQEHNRLSKRMYKKPEYCAACHKQFIDQEVNRVGWVQLQNQYDNWAASHWNKKGDARTTVECRECHMPLTDSTDPAAGDSSDYNRSADDHKHRSHRFLAANNFVPTLLRLEGGENQVQQTNQWLQGKIEIPEIRDKWAEGSVVKIRVETPPRMSSDEHLILRVVLTSNKVGHDYPTGPLDMIQSWVEVHVRNAAGHEVFASGERDSRNFLEPGTFLFKAEPVDQYGNLIDRHNLWEMVGVRYRRSLFPGYSDTVEYNVVCPSSGWQEKPQLSRSAQSFSVPVAPDERKLLITATLHYRKIDQFLLNYVMGEKSGLTAPVVDIASTATTVCVARSGEVAKCQ